MKKLISLLLIVVLTVPTTLATNVEHFVAGSVQYVLSTMHNPQVGTSGGEWAILGLARSGHPIPQDTWNYYYQAVEDTVVEHNGILHEKKYTEYARVVLALTAIGADPTNVAGYNLLAPLGDYEKTIWQGVNGAIWAMIALDSGDYTVPTNIHATMQATRELYIAYILDSQLPNGGWSLQRDAELADPDLTAMALQALAPYRGDTSVNIAIDCALDRMSEQQNSTGGFTAFGEDNLESSAQMLVSLCALGISVDDARFVKNGHSLLDFLLNHRLSDGSFYRTTDKVADQMASEQGLYALVAVNRMNTGKSNLYQMNDVTIQTSSSTSIGLPNKHDSVQQQTIILPNATFTDISSTAQAPAIIALATRGILDGKSTGIFAPDDTMTRAEFATIVVRALGLPTATTTQFSDVSPDAWFAPYVGAAYQYGIIEGVDDTHFSPMSTISRQEAAVMVARAAALCGIEQTLSTTAIRNILAGFVDYVTVAPWAQHGVALCYYNQILDDNAIKIEPQESVNRAEVAQMIYNLLDVAKLL